MPANGWAIVSYSDELDNTVDGVFADDGTIQNIADLVPNPNWFDDGAQTTPDANGEDRYEPFDADNVNEAEVLLFAEETIESARRRKAEVQTLFLDRRIDIVECEKTVNLNP
ncbi:hypothetical protein Lepto7376_4532 [[Leptolyngbya] sp. PCC 7376]|uniref:hypothetical protein n=1 Tax=[Leptolyngbya] sp. PCC 7376 TaxID=111781 RepID=UPI00029EEE21|nr:hypothetical protein [[Leptolyngbya] sp. PCC 7376]AFY40630.1 hypothetical protein Lepto7376_4532 [[Leptolyngbya] sp. PCC 7376]